MGKTQCSALPSCLGIEATVGLKAGLRTVLANAHTPQNYLGNLSANVFRANRIDDVAAGDSIRGNHYRFRKLDR